MVAPLAIALVYFVLRVTPIIVTFVRVSANKTAVNSVHSQWSTMSALIKTGLATIGIHSAANTLQTDMNKFITVGKTASDAYDKYIKAKKSYDYAISVHKKIKTRIAKQRGRSSKVLKDELAQAKLNMDYLKKEHDKKLGKLTDASAKFGIQAKDTLETFLDLKNKVKLNKKKKRRP